MQNFIKSILQSLVYRLIVNEQQKQATYPSCSWSMSSSFGSFGSISSPGEKNTMRNNKESISL